MHCPRRLQVYPNTAARDRSIYPPTRPVAQQQGSALSGKAREDRYSAKDPGGVHSYSQQAKEQISGQRPAPAQGPTSAGHARH